MTNKCAYVHCGKPFIPASSNQRFHSDQCRYRQRHVRDRGLRETGSKALRRGRVGEYTHEALTSLRGDLSAFQTTFIVNDTQWPYIDRGIWDAACAIAEDLDPDILVYAGDMLDLPMLSTYAHNPYESANVAQSVSSFHEGPSALMLSCLDETVDKIMVAGNHEIRWTKSLIRKAPELVGVVSEQNALGFDDWKYIEYGQNVGHLLADDLLVAHGWYARKHSAYTAKAHVEESGISVLHGHTHRVGHYAKTTLGGQLHGYELGHMCDPLTCPKNKQGTPNWQAVAGTVVRVHENGSWTVDVINVFGRKGDRRAVWNDIEYRIGG